MSNILVSTITPCFRMKPYLRRFLEELPRQTMFEQMEVVLDHNEPDAEELEWVAAFAAKHPGRLRHIVTTPVAPIGVSMNACIRHARGEFLAIWNVDDLRTPGSLEAQLRALRSAPQAGTAFGDYKIVWSFGSRDGRLVCDRGRPEAERHRGMLLGPFYMFRADLCRRAGLFDEQLRSGADFDFALRLLSHAGAVATSEPLGYYLNEGLGASTRPGSLQSLERNVVYMRYGIWDKFDLDCLPELRHYDVYKIVNGGDALPVASLFRDYESMMARRTLEWFPRLPARRRPKIVKLLKQISMPMRQAAKRWGVRELIVKVATRWS